jgi:hypothetical protein
MFFVHRCIEETVYGQSMPDKARENDDDEICERYGAIDDDNGWSTGRNGCGDGYKI